ncbi:hypothetical protein EJ07DRAFT_152489 [Lizonia empirigonia]|nr:hypothetical protein EJ07DRAFT_152489 [Lizonia empirigonia]
MHTTMAQFEKGLFAKKSGRTETEKQATEGSFTGTSSSTSFNLMRLPAEIRVQIYKEVILSAENVDVAGPFYSARNDDGNIPFIGFQYDRHHSRSEDSLYTSMSTLVNCTADILSLRLTNHRIKLELDYKIVQHTVAKMNKMIRAIRQPLGYSPIIQSSTQNSFWDIQPLLAIDPQPKTYKDVQSVQMTTYVSDIHQPNDLETDEQDLLNVLGPHVRSLTLNMALPEHVSALSEQQVRGITVEAVEMLTFHMFRAICKRSMCRKDLLQQHLTDTPFPAVGVVEVEINFPPGHFSLELGLLNFIFAPRDLAELQMRPVISEEGELRGVVFGLAGLGKVAGRRRTRSERVLGLVKTFLGKMIKWTT